MIMSSKSHLFICYFLKDLMLSQSLTGSGFMTGDFYPLGYLMSKNPRLDRVNAVFFFSKALVTTATKILDELVLKG